MGKTPDMNPHIETTKAALMLRLKALLTMPNTKILKSRRFGFLGAICGAALLAIVMKPSGTADVANADIDIAETAALETPAIDLAHYAAYLDDGSSTRFEERRIAVKSGDSLGPLLQKHGVSPGEAYKITESFSSVYDPRYVKVGQSFNFIYDGQQIKDVVYKPNIDRTVFVERNNNGDFTTRDITAEFKFDQSLD